MTIDKFGRVTPVQGYMLGLIGYSISRSETILPASDEDRMKNMQWGRKGLRSITSQDFGYDLSAWHEFLLSNKEYGFKHHYGFSGVRKAVEEAIPDPEHTRIVSILEGK